MKLTLASHTVLGISLAILGTAGCQSWGNRRSVDVDVNQETDQQLRERANRPTLVSARDPQINWFGELPDRGDVPYFTRTAASLVQHTTTAEGADFDVNLEGRGDRMVFASTRHNRQPDLYYKSIDGTAITQLTADPAADVQPVWSPDQRQIAFASNRAGNWDIWVVGLDGQRAVQVTSSLADDVHPSWSPDGSQIVYCSLPPRGQWELWIADADHGGKKQFIGYGLFPEWSPSGDTIVYQRARDRGNRWFSIWTLTFDQGEPGYPTEIAANAEASLITPSWSHDGLRVVYAAVSPALAMPTLNAGVDRSDIWVVDANGESRVRLTDGHSSNFGPTWAPDDRVFFTSGRDGHETIWSVVPGGTSGAQVDITAQRPSSAPTVRMATGG